MAEKTRFTAEKARGVPFWIVDGRHRWAAAQMAGVTDLRCDVLTSAGGRGLKTLTVTELYPDPDVQLDFAFDERAVKRMAAAWDERLVGVLAVVQANEMSVPDKAKMKLGRDRARRNVSRLEHFMIRLAAGEEQALEIEKIVKGAGWRLMKLRAGKPYDQGIEAVKTVEDVYSDSPELLSKTLKLMTTWRGRVGCNSNWWVGGVAQFVKDGYAESLTPSMYERLGNLMPNVVTDNAVAESKYTTGSGGGGYGSPVAFLIAEKLRSTAKLKRRSR